MDLSRPFDDGSGTLLRRPSAAYEEFADSSLEESGFEPLVPLRNQHNRGIGPISPIASIRVPL
jgi:hypothetical protein